MLMKKVLIATDFSPAADRLLNCIDELKEMGLEEAVIVHVIDIRLGEESSPSLQMSNDKKLKDITDRLEAHSINCKVYTPLGFAATEIVQIAKIEEVSIILIGSRGRSVIKEIFIGSTTFDVIRLSDVPVLIEKYKKDKENQLINVCINKFEKILLPIDFSNCSSFIINEILESSLLIKEIILLSVVEEGESKKELDIKKAQYREKLQEFAEGFEKKGISAKTEVLHGIPSKAITKTAEKELVTSIIMGTRGRGLIKSLLLGSTSDAVARTATRPVILIPCNKK
ncbi:universal stress protein [Alkaliphilus pronyensis]|uniref:Universal stress protein n=1 Tax=Alkaliphilus pronyensis TaxID=1482732 RepID=A0A6I0FDI8_9FIRM|nr:universal stress protein [Alkaliphilus pronyensis]KAB3540971.1 universal stress protein [Alkaliphilus pronyensis]